MKNKKFWIVMLVMSPITILAQIAPVVGGAIIGGAANLLSGLFGSASAAEERKKQMLLEAQNQNFQAQNESAKNLGASQQRAFESLMAGYRDALLRR